MSSPLRRRATTYPAVVGQVLARIRSERGLTQAAVANGLDLTQGSWSRIERGESGLTVDQLRDACDVLGVRPGDVLRRAEQATAELKGMGVQVAKGTEDAVKAGLVILGAVAVGALIASMFEGDEST